MSESSAARPPIESPIGSRGIESTPPAVLALIAALGSLLLYLPAIGEADIVGDDEARDFGVVRSLAEGGSLLLPEFNAAVEYEHSRLSNVAHPGALLPDFNYEELQTKPPLFYWIAAVVMKVSGASDEWTGRLPSALLAAGTVALTVACGASIVGAGPAFLGGCLLAVMPKFHAWARMVHCDMLMVFLVAGCVFLFHLSPQPLSRSRRWLFHALLGLTFLAKSLAGCGLVAVVVMLESFFGGRRPALRSLIDPSIIASLAPGGAWLAFAGWNWGASFVFQHFLTKNLAYFFGQLATGESAGSWLFHLSHFLNIVSGTFPWGLVLPLAVLAYCRTPKELRSPGQRFLVFWIAGGLGYFTLSARKPPYYLLPLYPAVGLFVGAYLWQRLVAALPENPLREIGWRPAAAGLITILVLAAIGWSASDRLPAELSLAAFAVALGRRPFLLPLCSGLLAAFGWAALKSLRDQRWGNATCLVWLTAVAASTLDNFLDGPIAARSSMRPFAIEVRRHVRPEDPIFFFKVPSFGVALYSRLTIPTIFGAMLPVDGPIYLVVAEAHAAELPVAWRARLEVVAKGEGQVYTRNRQGIELLRLLPAGEKDGESPNALSASSTG